MSRAVANLMLFAGCLTLGVGRAPSAEPTHWSFRPIVRPAVPALAKGDWSRNQVDIFIQERLQQESLSPSADASRTTLLRRIALDLTGLPPVPEDDADFFSTDQPDAYERQVDRLMASPRYAERWTRVWLDLCHYGDTDGHLTDQLRPVAWRYRDWVFQSINRNLPFDEFTIQQIAGDLLTPDKAEHPSSVLGTGFLRQTLSNREGGADLEHFRVEQVVDRTSMVGTIWLGLTAGCARCHDHKYDPLTQEEFFGLYACFDRADEVNIDAPLPLEREAYLLARPEYERRRREIIEPFRQGLTRLQQMWESKLLHALAHPGEDHVWDRQWEVLGLIWGGNLGEGQLEGTETVKRPWDKRTLRQQDDLADYFLQHGSIIEEKEFVSLKLGQLREDLAQLKKEFPAAFCTRAPVMRSALTPRQSYIHERGEFRSHGPLVQPGVPAWLPGSIDLGPAPRLALAQWLVSRQNPLTARVTVNRIWQEYFGRGIVLSPDNFGLRGDAPTQPQLLDWLASEFVASEWDVKRMHRLVVNSATYRQSSQSRPELLTKDPSNRLFARQASLRVPAETVRDASLSISGLLSSKVGGPSVFPPQSERVSMEAFGSNLWKVSSGEDRYRRGLYTFIQRTSPFAQGITFDAPSPQKLCTRRDRSNTPLQALTLLNDPAFFEMAGAFAQRIVNQGGTSDTERARFAIHLALARPANTHEMQRIKRHIEELRNVASGDGHGKGQLSEIDIWTDVASVLLNLHEFVTRD